VRENPTPLATVSPGGAQPLVSVLIPSFNRAAFLPEALDSVLAQTYRPIEIIVVDDGSTDETPAVLARYGDGIRSVRQTNGGLARARNAGLAEARGELLALFDSDDLCHPGRIAAQVACLRRFPQAVVCSSDFSSYVDGRVVERSHIASYYSRVQAQPGGVQALYSHAETLPVPAWPEAGPVTARTGEIYEQLVWGNFVHPPTVMVRRSVLDAVGAFDESMRTGTDYDWLLRTSRTGAFAYIDSPLLLYRYSSDQLSGPSNRAASSLATVAVLSKVVRDDPEFHRRHAAQLRRRVGECYRRAAEASPDGSRGAALGLLLKSVRHGIVDRRSMTALVKILAPQRLRRRLRRLRGTASGGA
jgi:glycosyltransferase involved in cell wall biosynthesis